MFTHITQTCIESILLMFCQSTQAAVVPCALPCLATVSATVLLQDAPKCRAGTQEVGGAGGQRPSTANTTLRGSYFSLFSNTKPSHLFCAPFWDLRQTACLHSCGCSTPRHHPRRPISAMLDCGYSGGSAPRQAHSNLMQLA